MYMNRFDLSHKNWTGSDFKKDRAGKNNFGDSG